jgi:hypothetical protein
MTAEHHPETEHERAAAAEAERKRKERHERSEDRLDEGLEETFPASDPVAVKNIT